MVQNSRLEISNATIDYLINLDANKFFNTIWKQCLLDLNINKLVEVKFVDSVESSFGSTLKMQHGYKVLINKNLFDSKKLHLLLITIFHELRHVYQAETNFVAPSLENSLTPNYCDPSVLSLSKTKLNISPYYFYYTSKLEHDAREYSFCVLEDIISNLKQYENENIQIKNFITNTKKYIQKERVKYVKFLTKMSAKQDKIRQKIKSVDKKLLNKIHNKNIIDKIFKAKYYKEIEILTNIYMDEEIKLELFNNIKKTQDLKLLELMNKKSSDYESLKTDKNIKQTQTYEYNFENYKNDELERRI